MVLPFLSIFFLISFIFVLKKRINNDGGDMESNKNNHNEKEKKQPVMKTVFKVELHCQNCIYKIQELVMKFEGVTNLSVDLEKYLVIVYSTKDVKALTEHLRCLLSRSVGILQHEEDENDKQNQRLDFILKKNNNGGNDKNNHNEGEKKDEKMTTAFKVNCQSCIDKIQKPVMQNEEEKGPVTRTVFKMDLHCEGCASKIARFVRRFEGVHAMSLDCEKNLVAVTGTMDNMALINYMRQIIKQRIGVVQSKKGGSGDGDGDGGGGDGDDNSGGGGKNKKKGCGGDGDSDGDGGDKAEGGGGGKMEAGSKLDCMGKGGFGYRYGYHAGFENGYPVGQLHVARVVNGDNLNGKEDKQSNEVGNGNGDGSGIDNNNNGGSCVGDKDKKKGDRGGGWIRKTKEIKIICVGQLGFGDGGGQLLVDQTFCRGNLNHCAAVRSVVLI